jgi:hypothetical protein
VLCTFFQLRAAVALMMAVQRPKAAVYESNGESLCVKILKFWEAIFAIGALGLSVKAMISAPMSLKCLAAWNVVFE